MQTRPDAPAKGPPAGDADLSWLWLLRRLCLVFLLTPLAILLLCGVLVAVNSNVGWQRYPLPGVLLLLYILAGAVSPLVGVAALVVLLVRRREILTGAKREGKRARIQTLVLAWLDVLAFPLWVLLLPLVFFSAGGTR